VPRVRGPAPPGAAGRGALPGHDGGNDSRRFPACPLWRGGEGSPIFLATGKGGGKPMSSKALQTLAFLLLIALTLYLAFGRGM
jgi:hypothetical protein